MTSDDELWKKFETAYPEAKEGALRTSLGMVRRYTREVKEGDGVITYDPERRTYFLGTIESGVEMREHALGRVRRVSWTRQVSRDALSPMTRNPLGSTLALFLVPAEARDEIAAKATPISEPPAETAPPPAIDEAGVVHESELVLEDTLARAERLIEDRLEALTWQAMQELVAGILRAMGYRTRVSRLGADRGIDIFASPDGLGLEEPRIFVEVKHRRGKMDAPQIRSFLGGRKRSPATGACT